MVDLHLGDCLDILPTLPDDSIDMVMVDLPYGTTACKWDSIIPLDFLWEQYNRICKKMLLCCLHLHNPLQQL